jgi:hypothetical protein
MNKTQQIKQRAVWLLAAMVVLILASRLLRADTGTCGGASTTLPFTDVPASNGFFCVIAQAYFTGLTFGTTATTYSPAANVTREQMAAFITRTQDSALKRGSRRAAAGQWAMPQDDDVLKKTTVGFAPLFNCFDGEDIWVANYQSGSVTRVHASDGRVLGTWTGASWATSAVAAAGFIYVAGNALASGEPGKIYRIDPSLAPGAVTVVESNLGNQPESMTYDGLNLWTANKGTGPGLGSITRYNIVTDTKATFGLGFNQPIGIVFDGTHLWVVDEEADALYRVNPADATILETIGLGTVSQFSIPAFDGSNIWVPVIGGVTIVSSSTPARLLATLTGNGLSGGENFAVAFDGERMLVTHYGGGSSSLVSLWKATSLTPLGYLLLTDMRARGVCSDGLHFWISVDSDSGSDFVLRY